MKDLKRMTKAELLVLVEKYQVSLLKIADYCNNPEQFKAKKHVSSLTDCYAYAVGKTLLKSIFALYSENERNAEGAGDKAPRRK